jgi:putative oxidoreductase
MKIAALIARLLLGLVFFVFGLNGFLKFIPTGPMPSGVAGDFSSILLRTHYMLFVSGVQVLGGLLLLLNRYVPLALVLLGPVLVNILLFHLLMFPKGLGMAIVATILWGILAFRHRRAFTGIFAQRAD